MYYTGSHPRHKIAGQNYRFAGGSAAGRGIMLAAPVLEFAHRLSARD
jgi:hypothetical protein